MKRIIQILFILALSLNGRAQNSSIEGMRTNWEPMLKLTEDSIDVYFDSTIVFTIEFKINEVAQADKVFIHVGNTDGGSQTASLTYDVNLSNGTYYLEQGNDSFEIYSGYVTVKIYKTSINVADFIYTEIWVEDNAQNLSAKEKLILL